MCLFQEILRLIVRYIFDVYQFNIQLIYTAFFREAILLTERLLNFTYPCIFRLSQLTSVSGLICNSLSDQVSIPPMLNWPQLQKKCSSSKFHISFEHAGQRPFTQIPCCFFLKWPPTLKREMANEHYQNNL